MDVYLLPLRRGRYALFAGELNTPPPVPPGPQRDPGSEPGTEVSTARKIWNLTKKGYQRVSWRRRQRELLLQSLGELELTHIRVHYPPSITEEEARSIYKDLLEEQTRQHKKWMTANAAAIPVTLPLDLIPGPNVLLFYPLR